MTDQPRAPLEPIAKRVAGPFNPLLSTLPVGTLTASVLFDLLALVADSPAQAQSFERGAADVLTVGLGGSLVEAGLEILDYLQAKTADPAATRAFALNGAVIAVYMLDVAVRRRAVEANKGRTLGGVLPTGLSVLGLALFAIAGKRP